jgi:imidazolonepropionase-like amidohydrolase
VGAGAGRGAAAALLAVLAAGTVRGAAPQEPAEEPAILLRGGTVLTMAGDPIPDGGVLINSKGKIASVGRALPAPDRATVVDCSGRFIVPGFIDAGTQVGLVDIDMVKAANDSDEGEDPSTPDLDVRDGVNVDSPVFGVTRSHGVTTVLVHPQDTNVINGRSALLHCLDGASVADRAVLLKETPREEAPRALHLSFGGSAKQRFAKKDKMPSTRMGVAAVIRREFEKAGAYREKKRRYEERKGIYEEWTKAHPGETPPKEGPESPEKPAKEPAMEVLADALNRSIPVFAGADRLDDIRTAIRIGEEFNLRLVLFGGIESWKVAKDLAERKIPVVYGPEVRQPDSPEDPGARMDGPRILREAGVLFCLMTGDVHNSRNLPYHAGIAASWGLQESDALAAITRDAARILGVGDLLGTLETGKEATLCVFQGSPLEPLSRLEHMYIRGKEVSLRNRQTELYERWR